MVLGPHIVARALKICNFFLLLGIQHIKKAGCTVLTPFNALAKGGL